MPTLGFDAFVTDLGVADEKTCRVCGEPCEVERSVFGPISLADWTNASRRYHDRFICPHAHKPWHRQALLHAQTAARRPQILNTAHAG